MAKLIRCICYVMYYCFARWLPPSYCPGRRVWREIRFILCRRLFDQCGGNVNIEAGVYFGSGKGIAIGDNSGIGVDGRILGPVKIGQNVMMGQEVLMIGRNHKFSDIHTPMIDQGYEEEGPITIGNDGWIGARAIILPGVSIGCGVVIGAGSVVTKDIPDWAIAAGNPAKVVRFRKSELSTSDSLGRLDNLQDLRAEGGSAAEPGKGKDRPAKMGCGSAEKSQRTCLKIAYLTGVFPATSQTFIMREVQGLKDFGFEITIFAARRSGDAEIEEELLEADPEWIFARPDNLWPHLVSNLKSLVLHPRRYLAALGFFLRQGAKMDPPAFARLLYHFFCGIGFSERMRREGIRHMHCHFSTGTNMALAAHLFSGISFSFTAHASGDIFVRPILIEEKVKHAEYVVAVCDYSRRYLDSITGYRYSPKIHRIYNGIDAAEPERLLAWKGGEVQRREEQNGKYQVISVGRLIGCKGFGTLLEALRILKGRGRRINCAIIGTGPEKKRLEELIQQWDLGDTVTLTGAFPLHRVYEILKESYLFVLLSEVHEDGTRDSFPTVILEAMAMSLPVIATSISGIPEMVVHGRTGLLVPERDADAAAAALERLIVDEALRLQMGEAGRLRALEMFGGHSQLSALAALMQGAMRAGQEGK